MRSIHEVPPGDRLAELEVRVAAIEEVLATRSQGPRDRDDRRVLMAVAATIAGHRFSCREVIAHTATDRVLAVVLDEAGVGNSSRSLGRLFRRVEGHLIDGVVLLRCGTDRDGVIWRCEFREFGSPHDR